MHYFIPAADTDVPRIFTLKCILLGKNTSDTNTPAEKKYRDQEQSSIMCPDDSGARILNSKLGVIRELSGQQPMVKTNICSLSNHKTSKIQNKNFD